jgi:very-short-patch-repair endonuclease
MAQAHRLNSLLVERARAMRHESVPAERELWWCLRDRRLNGYKFRRQVPFGPFIADFYCAQCMLIVELDGNSHSLRLEYDASRSEWFTSRGYHVIRFSNIEVHKFLEAVLVAILKACEDRTDFEYETSQPSP